jgi:hypothetical protein
MVVEHELVTDSAHCQPVSNDSSQRMGQVGVELRGGRGLEDARLALLSSGQEELVAAFGRCSQTPNGVLVLVAETEQAPEELIWRDDEGTALEA